MRLFLSRRFGALATSALLAGWAISCAKDAGIGDNPPGPVDGGNEAAEGGGTGGSSGSGGSSGDGGSGGWPTAGFGSPCQKPTDCSSDQCTDIGKTKKNLVCTQACKAGTTCPNGGYCAWKDGVGYVCIPDTKNECAQCKVDTDCKNTGDECATSPLYDHFCARDCSFDGICPTGFTCTAPGAYGPGGGADAGASGAGNTDAGSGDGGAKPNPARICVPDNGDSCPCNAGYSGETRTCKQTSGTATCEGKETCNGSTSKWEGCTASTPQPEVCDGADNDCNGIVDDGAGTTTGDAALCANAGTVPPHSGAWTCQNGQCVAGSCDPAWAHYPAALPPSAGCACPVETADQPPADNNSCANATPSGSVSDATITALNLVGRLTSDTDEDWYKFDTVDTDEGTTNSYHIAMKFTEPTSNSEFVFDVIRGATCATPDAAHSNLQTYDWCVDATGTDGSGQAIGELSCGATAPIHCGPHDKSYLVRVHRAAGATGTCSEYSLTVTAKGGSCDMTQTCDPQVSEN